MEVAVCSDRLGSCNLVLARRPPCHVTRGRRGQVEEGVSSSPNSSSTLELTGTSRAPQSSQTWSWGFHTHPTPAFFKYNVMAFSEIWKGRRKFCVSTVWIFIICLFYWDVVWGKWRSVLSQNNTPWSLTNKRTRPMSIIVRWASSWNSKCSAFSYVLEMISPGIYS